MKVELWATICCEKDKGLITTVSFGITKEQSLQRAEEQGYKDKPLVTLLCGARPKAFVEGFKAFLAKHNIIGDEATEIIHGFVTDLQKLVTKKS